MPHTDNETPIVPYDPTTGKHAIADDIVITGNGPFHYSPYYHNSYGTIYTIGNRGQRVAHDARYFRIPEEAIAVTDPTKFENLRLAQAKQADIYGTHRFANAVQGLVGGLVMTPAITTVAPVVGEGILAGGDKVASAYFNLVPKATQQVINAGVTSYFGAEGLNNFISNEGYAKTQRLWNNGQYGRSLLSATGDVLDLSMAAPALKAIKKLGSNAINSVNNIYKDYRDFKKFHNKYRKLRKRRIPFLDSYYETMRDVIRSLSMVEVPKTLADRERFIQRFKNRDTSIITEFFNLSDEVFSPAEKAKYIEFFKRNPEYGYFLNEKYGGINNIPKDEIISAKNVDAFLERQSKGVRGVYGNNIEEGIKFLSEVHAKRKGGDRLHSNGGLYTSNTRTISDRFKNPIQGSTNGYTSNVLLDLGIPLNLSPEEKLNAYRKLFYNIDVFPLDSRRPMHIRVPQSAKGVESRYITKKGESIGDNIAGYERAILPKDDALVSLENVQEYQGQVNKNGRWGHNVVPEYASDLFIPRQITDNDFIDYARIFLLSPIKEHNPEIYSRLNKIMNSRMSKFHDLSMKQAERHLQAYHKYNKWENIIGKSLVGTGVSGTAIGIPILINYFRNKYKNSSKENNETNK